MKEKELGWNGAARWRRYSAVEISKARRDDRDLTERVCGPEE